MKPDRSAPESGRRGVLLSTAGRPAVLSLAVIGLGACSTASTRPSAAGAAHGTRPAVPPTSQWVKVLPSPPTWFPRGTPADHPTDHRSGEWVLTEDSLGSRYFIPLRGIEKNRRELLVRQALAARDPGKVSRIAREDALRVAGAGAGTVLLFTPPGLLAWGAKHGIGPGPGSGGGPGSIGSIGPICGPAGIGACGR